MTMIERVARAICGRAEGKWDDLGKGQALFLDLARAAIEAMREPTEAMLEAAEKQDEPNYGTPYPGEAKHVWPAMIDAALSKDRGEARND